MPPIIIAFYVANPGREMKKVQSCDDLTDQQKKTRIEWIIAELQDNDVLVYNYVYDRDKLVIGEPEEVLSVTILACSCSNLHHTIQ